MELGVEDEGTEVQGIPKRLENRAVELSREIDLTLTAVAEAKPQHVIPNVTRFH
jgi:hypothetical protein